MSTPDTHTSRRRRTTAIGAVAIVIVGLVVWIITRSGPADIVEDYLAALADGDVETALTFSEDVDDKGLPRGLLTPDAMPIDTTTRIRSVVEQPDRATVLVEFAGPDDEPLTGRFTLSNGDDGWTIDNPLVNIDVKTLPVDHIEVNGVVVDGTDAWMFPGVYTLYGETFGAALSLPPFRAVPGNPDGYWDRVYAPELTPTNDVDFMTETVADWMQACTAETSATPDGCPFRMFASSHAVQVDGRYYTVDVFEWGIVTPPTVVPVIDGGRLVVSVRDAGVVSFSFKGTTEDGRTVDVAGECVIAHVDAALTFTVDGLSIAVLEDPRPCRP